MIPLDQFKQILGASADNLSDEEIKRIRDTEDRLADLIFDMWLEERKKHAETENG